MRTMCHNCGSELTKSGSGGHCRICSQPLCAECVKKEISFCCKSYSQNNNGKESSTQHALSPYGTPLISPAISLSSIESGVSSCSEFSVDVNIQRREDAVEGILYSDQEGKCNVNNQSSSLNFYSPMEEINKFNSIMADNHEDIYMEKLSSHDNLSKDVKDPHIWLPPEPEDKEDDIECSVADNDDDDEYSDGTKWGQPSSLSSYGEEHSKRYRFREKRRKALVEVMNVHFRDLLSQLLATAGVAFSEEAGESWLDIVSSLSWKAATLIKPDATEGRSMDPSCYVKVKCIASGSRSQSQVIRGLVFKKNAAHKHMPTKYKNPRLLLLLGVLGQRVLELSSFDSMEEETNYLRSTIEMIETCQPNVVLVEKTVSRDIQESLLSKGITLVYDMKLPRLERISRCTGSQVLSSTDSFVHLELKKCDSFHIEKFVLEHSSAGEGGRQPSKTLMYFEGCPKPLGCTILLKGAHNDELKKVKCVVWQAIFLAYHLILETSFLVDQRATFSSTQTLGTGGFSTGKHSFASDASSPDTSSAGIASSYSIDQEKSQDAICDVEKTESLQACSELSLVHCDVGISKEVQLPVEDYVETELDPMCILVLQSSQCVLRGTTLRKRPHLSCIKYYGDSDMSLGRFLLDNLLNQKNQCSDCGKPPGGHTYSYTHKNGKLMISVKRLQPEFLLPGEAEGKLWMWTRCLKCEQQNRLPKSTQRVVMSGVTRGLSLGKFLELGFSNCLASSRLSSCGHLLHRDCLQFYGLGSTVVMFSYSSVDIYKACMPPQVLEFNNPNGQEWLDTEAKDVLRKGNLLFMEVMNSLQNMVSRLSLSKQTASLMGSTKEFSGIEEMLRLEKSDFEALLQKAINKNVGQTVHQILGLNRLNRELLLELYVWDRRLHALGLSSKVNSDTCNPINEEQLQLLKDDSPGRRIEEKNAMEYSDKIFEEPTRILPLKDGPSLSYGEEHHADNLSSVETDLEIKLKSTSHSDESIVRDVTVSQPSLADADHESRHAGSQVSSSIDYKYDLIVGSSIGGIVAVSSNDERTISSEYGDLHESFPNQELSIGPHDLSSISDHLSLNQAIPTAAEITRRTTSVADINLKTEAANWSSLDEVKESVPTIPTPKHSLPSNLENSEGWVWTPFSETRKAYRKDLQRGLSQKFEFINNYTPAYLSTANKFITRDMSRLHFPVDTDDNVVSVYEEEFSSIIACALALLQDQYSSTDNITEFLPGLVSDVAMAFPHWWSSSSSLDLEGSHSGQRISSDELSTSGSEEFFTADPLQSSRAMHPEIPIGSGKLPGKSKYSVVCIHGKEFYSLRRRCCPSELDYISSLSRCKTWDAQGGKSGAYFAKTLDDRFIVKNIQKTEFDSFLMFAPDYFNYITHSLSSGSQTCLAKILGIYQVIIRQSKGWKEVKIDLIVMENIFFGRNISRKYDLKGTLHRHASSTKEVLLDQNFVNDMNLSPFYVNGETKHLLQRAIWNDTSFLTSIKVMDYSLLLGVDKQRREIVFGIIDYLRQYTWDKHLETWVKTSLVVPKNELPTVISPKEYKKRFRNFMSLHFLTVPDRCCSE